MPPKGRRGSLLTVELRNALPHSSSATNCCCLAGSRVQMEAARPNWVGYSAGVHRLHLSPRTASLRGDSQGAHAGFGRDGVRERACVWPVSGSKFRSVTPVPGLMEAIVMRCFPYAKDSRASVSASTCVPSAMCSAAANSSGRWLTPPRHGMKSMATGASRARNRVSW